MLRKITLSAHDRTEAELYVFFACEQHARACMWEASPPTASLVELALQDLGRAGGGASQRGAAVHHIVFVWSSSIIKDGSDCDREFVCLSGEKGSIRTTGLEDAQDLVSYSSHMLLANNLPFLPSFPRINEDTSSSNNIPVTTLTWAMPWLSRRTTPICEGVAPFLASLQICSTTCSGVVFSHEGGLRL